MGCGWSQLYELGLEPIGLILFLFNFFEIFVIFYGHEILRNLISLTFNRVKNTFKIMDCKPFAQDAQTFYAKNSNNTMFTSRSCNH